MRSWYGWARKSAAPVPSAVSVAWLAFAATGTVFETGYQNSHQLAGCYNRVIMKYVYEDLIRANEIKCQAFTFQGHKKSEIVKNIRSALELYKKVLNENGENTGILRAIASCYYHLASIKPQGYPMYDDAISIVQRAIELDPDNGFLHANLGEYYFFGNPDYERAVAEFRKTIQLNPNYVHALGLASLLYDNPEPPVTIQETISWLERLVSIEPNNPIRHARLAEKYFEDGQLEHAEDEAIKSFICSQPLQTGWPKRMKKSLINDLNAS